MEMDVVESPIAGSSRSAPLRVDCFRSIREVPRILWDQFAPRDAVGLEYAHLQAVEESGINELHPYYLIGYGGGSPVGIAYCFAIDVDLGTLSRTCPPDVLRTVRSWKPEFMKVRVVEVGHIASLGSTIAVIEPWRVRFLKELIMRIDRIAHLEHAAVCLIRDVAVRRIEEYRGLEECGYRAVPGFAIARMSLRWNSFEGYLASLKSKRRNAVMRRRAKLRAPEISVELIEDYAPHARRLAELWENVAERNNGYEHERLTPAFFEAMSRRLRKRSHVVAIKRNEQIVAYGLNLVGDEEYLGMAEGLDYGFRDEYDLYANTLLEGLRVACEMGMKSYNIGVTTYDFKTSVGAELDRCAYFVKAANEPCCGKVYAELLKRGIAQPDNLHFAFRNSEKVPRLKADDFEAMLRPIDDPCDLFAKHRGYPRAEAARATGIYGYFPLFEVAQEPVIRHAGREVIMLGTNSYLGLSTHPAIKDAMHRAIDRYGSGCSGSPLLNGTLDLHDRLTRTLARFLKKEDALLFSTGYQTNLGAISALASRGDVVIMDHRNHASLLDGARLAGAELIRYRHRDSESLENALRKNAHRPKLVVSDSLFSMEGTVVDLPAVVRLVRRYGARLMLDESHAIGVLGNSGRGVAERFGLLDDVDIVMGTFSKAFASIGGFIAGAREVLDVLRHTARSHVFSASLPPCAVAAVLEGIRIVHDEPERRTKVMRNAVFLADGLRGLGFEVGGTEGPIISVACGHELVALGAFQKLFEDGVFVNPVTWPAVPRSREVLRISVMATHEQEALERALAVFGRLRTPTWPFHTGTAPENAKPC